MNDSIDNLIDKNIPQKSETKVIGWIKRYGLAELVSTATSYSCYYITDWFSGNEVLSAYGATAGASLGFYGTMLFRDLKKDYLVAKENSQQYGLKGFLKTVRNLLIEFGGAEVLDVTLTRPAATAASVYLFGKNTGIFVGKIIADIAFYIPAIVSYELMKKRKTTATENFTNVFNKNLD